MAGQWCCGSRSGRLRRTFRESSKGYLVSNSRVDTTKLLAFLRQHRLAVEASVSSARTPQAAVVGIAVTDRFEIVFDTVDSTRKARNLRINPRIAFVIGGVAAGEERTVQYEGVADE